MLCNSNKGIITFIHCFTICSLLVIVASNIYFLYRKDFSWTLKFGNDIQSPPGNFGFYLNMSSLLWMLTALLFAIFELLMIFNVNPIHGIFFHGFTRPALYLSMGLCHLGISNDLGIAAGFFIMIVAVVWLILNAFALNNRFQM